MMPRTMKILYCDAFSGVSGDMLLGGLLDLGVPLNKLQNAIDSLGLGVELKAEIVKRCGLRGISVTVIEHEKTPPPIRDMNAFCQILDMANLSNDIKKKTLGVLQLLFHAEARVHGISVEKVRLHELGSIDTLIDIVGTVYCLDFLDIETIYSSSIPISSGWVNTHHGPMPVPAPAVSILMEGLPVHPTDVKLELVTPTGLALLKYFSKEFGSFPQMNVEKTGFGAGSRDIQDHPNLLRLWLGHSDQTGTHEVIELVTVIDDIPLEIIPHTIEKLLSKGALDAYMCPTYMKKGRPGVELKILSPIGLEHELMAVLFYETTTTGIRVEKRHRVTLPRRHTIVETPWGPIAAKEVTINNEKRAYPEFEDAKRVSVEIGIPLIEIYNFFKRATDG